MKHTILREYEGTKNLYLFQDNIYTVRGSNSELFRNHEKLDSNVEMYSLFSINGNICYIKEDKTILSDKRIDKNIILTTIAGNYAVFTSNFDLENETLNYEVVHLKSGEIVHTFGHLNYNCKLIAYKNDYLIVLTDQILCFNQEKSILKKVKASEIIVDGKTEFTKIIGIDENSIYISTNRNQVVSINLSDLSLKTIWKSIPGLQIGDIHGDSIPDASIFEIDKENQKLVGFFDKCYFEIDIVQETISFKDLSEELYKKRINSFRPTSPLPINGNYIISIGHFDLPQNPNVDYKGIVVLNKKDLTIYDTFIFQDTDIGTRTPIFGKDVLYLVDWDKRVHKFEIE